MLHLEPCDDCPWTWPLYVVFPGLPSPWLLGGCGPSGCRKVGRKWVFLACALCLVQHLWQWLHRLCVLHPEDRYCVVSPSVSDPCTPCSQRVHRCVSVPVWVQVTTATQGLKKDSGIESKIEKMLSLTRLSFCKLGGRHCCFIRAVFILSLM